MFFRQCPLQIWLTPTVSSYTELMVGMEGRKRPMFIIIAIAAKVADRPFMSPKWGVVKCHTCREGRQNRGRDIDLHGIPCHKRHTQFKARGSQGSHSLHPWWLLKRTLLIVLPVILINIPVSAFLNPVSTYCWGQSGTSWRCLATADGTHQPRAPISRKLRISFVYFALLLVLLVLLVKLF